MLTIVLVFTVTLITIGSQLVLKGAIDGLVDVLRTQGVLAFVIEAATTLRVILAVTMQGMGYVLWWFVIAQERLSVAFAISGSFFYLTMAAASWILYDEKLSIQQWIGLTLITAGVLIVNLFKEA